MGMLIDFPETTPGVDLSYQLALPSYAATAWYHRKLPNRPADLKPELADVEQFATQDPYVVNGLVSSWRVFEWRVVTPPADVR